MKLSAVAFVLAVLLQAALAQTTVSLSVYAPAPGNIQYQQKPIFSTTVTPTAAGSINVYVDGNLVGNCQISGTSNACNVSSTTLLLSVGNHEAYSSYSATGGTTTNSSHVTFKVYATTILVTTSNPSGPNIAPGVVIFTVTTQNVPSNIGGPTGTIAFIDASHGGATIGTCTITNVAFCTASATLSPGTNYTIFASYNGDQTFDNAYSPSIFFTVSGSATTAATVATTGATATTGTTGATATTGSTTASVTSGNQTVTSSTSSTSGTTVNPTTATTGTTVNPTITTGTTVNPTITTGATATTGTTGSTTGPTPTPAPTNGNPTTTGQITTTTGTTTANATATPHPTAAPTKAPTSSAAWTLPSLAISAVLAVLAL